MKKVSRRTFIVGASAGAAGVALGAGVPTLVTAIEGSNSTSASAVKGPLMAYAIDPSRGDVVLLNGGKKVTVHDPDLVQRLVKAAQ